MTRTLASHVMTVAFLFASGISHAQDAATAQPSVGSSGPQSTTTAAANATAAAGATRSAASTTGTPQIQLFAPPQPQLCVVPAGLAIGTLATAGTLTFGRIDKGCEARLDASMWAFLGQPETAVARLCQSKENQLAAVQAGRPCPVATTTKAR